MAVGKLSEVWALVTKGAIAEAILGLTKLQENLRAPAECINTPTVRVRFKAARMKEESGVVGVRESHFRGLKRQVGQHMLDGFQGVSCSPFSTGGHVPQTN